ncbi:MAG: hypothetical protein Q7S24_02035, partial [bacterium]|nr:hypothetical protein [bacterium]
MLDIFFLIVILTGLAVAGYIVIRKFPQLSNLDTVNLPQEKISRKKKEIIDRRIEAHSKEIQAKSYQFLIPVRKWWGRFQLRFRVYVGKIERLWHHELNKKQKAESDMPSAEREL